VTEPEPGAAPRRAGPLREERRAAAWSAAGFFCLLGGYFLLRPVRDLLAVRADPGRLDDLFRATLVATVVVSLAFGALVARAPRRRFLPWAYRAFALQVLAFAVWGALARGGGVVAFAETYFVWLSVLNLFLVSVFWGFMADLWSLDAAKRTYGRIALGGTAGALAGSLFGLGLRRALATLDLPAEEIATFVPVLFVAAAVLIEVAVRCLRRAEAAAPPKADAPAVARPLGGSAWEGILAVARSPYLLGIAGYLLLHTAAVTVLYVVRAHAVAGSGLTEGGQADLFFWAEVAVQSATLAVQAAGTATLLALLGVGGALAAVPLLVLSGAGADAAVATVGAAVAALALARVAHFALGKPATESLYTLVSRPEKYKAKSFVDTFVYRSGDWLSSEAADAVRVAHGTSALPVVALPICAAGSGLGWALGRAARRRRAAPA
jgi:AAA family ATP:ADP antiporter